jgi:cation transport regulator ChaC
MAPDRMAAVSPAASFEFIAHLPEWGLEFPIDGNGWGGALPSAAPASGSTVWGVVYSVPDADRQRLENVEKEEGRVERSVEAIDRTGRRHTVITHLADTATGQGMEPSSDYVAIMLIGSRHWSLPAGWIAGLEEHLGSGF